MDKQVLVLDLSFLSEEGKKFRVRVANPKPGLTKETVLNAMTVLATEGFFEGQGLLKPIKAAYIKTSNEEIYQSEV